MMGPRKVVLGHARQNRKVASRVCQEILRIPFVSVPMVLEGGSIHTDGDGTLLVTKEHWLNRNRNSQLGQDVIEGVLKRVLGVEVVIWLPDGLNANEDTKGQVDNFCCFTEPVLHGLTMRSMILRMMNDVLQCWKCCPFTRTPKVAAYEFTSFHFQHHCCSIPNKKPNP